ncbi:MAG: amidohydrolase family protein [Firmicutes bacterium]|nr:amidohydrolase family protein [Bacillota bacterium]
MAFNLFKKKTTADTLFCNGTIITLDPDAAPATAVAVKDGVVLAVGDEEDLQELCGKSTQRIDLEGGALVPGFFDSESTLVRDTFAQFSLALSPSMDLPQIVDALAVYIAEHPEADRLFAFGYSEDLFAEEEAARTVRALLDPLSPEKPLFLLSDQGNQMLLNSAALDFVHDFILEEYRRMQGVSEHKAAPRGTNSAADSVMSRHSEEGFDMDQWDEAEEEEEEEGEIETDNDPWPLLRDTLIGYQYYRRDEAGIITGCAEGPGLTGWLMGILEPFDPEEVSKVAWELSAKAAASGYTALLESGCPDYLSRTFLSFLINNAQEGNPLQRYHSTTVYKRETDIYLSQKRLDQKQTLCSELEGLINANTLTLAVSEAEEGQLSLGTEFMTQYAVQAADHGYDVVIQAAGPNAAQAAAEALQAARTASKKARLTLKFSGLTAAAEDKLEDLCLEEDLTFVTKLPAPGSLPQTAETAEALLDVLCGRAAQMLRRCEKTGSIAKGNPADFTVLERDPLATGEDPRTIPVIMTVLSGNPVSLEAPASDDWDEDAWEDEEEDDE